MAKVLKVVGIVFTVIIILFIVAGVLLTKLVDPNQFKSKISQEVFQSTGHQLKINGDISWSFFPWLGFKVSDVALGNLKEFGNNDMATVKVADVKVSLLPLFYGKVDVSNITLNNLQLNLIKNSNGVGNWENPTATKTSATKTTNNNANTSSKSGINLEVDNVDISGGNISWHDQQNGQDVTLKNISIQGKHIALNTPFSIAISSDVVGNSPKIKTHVEISGDFDINSDFSRFSLTNFSAGVGSLTVNGSVTGGSKDNAVSYSGNLTVEKFNPKAWLQSMGMGSINTVDSNALTAFGGKINFKGTGDSFNVDKIQLTLDNSHLTGDFAVQSFKTQAIRFQLTVDQFNADNYLLKPAAQSSTTTTANTGDSAGSQQLPLDTLRALNINGTMSINKLIMMKLHTTNASVAINANGGLLKLAPVKADLYNGKTVTVMTYDVRTTTPMLTVTSDTRSVQMQPLLSDFMNVSSISGLTDFSLNVNARGADTTSITKTLGGNGRFSLTNGKLSGVNLGYQLQRAQAMLSKSAAPSQSGSNETDLGYARGTFTLTNGIATNNDLDIQSSLLKATGQGTINLPDQSMDYTLYLIPTGSGALQGQQIPLPYHREIY